jgi:bacillithiol synthase
LNALYDVLLERASKADPTLKGAVEARRTRAMKDLDRLGQGFVRAAKREQETALQRMERAHEDLFPNGGLQERRDNILPMLAAKGIGLLDELLEQLDPLDPHFSLLVED